MADLAHKQYAIIVLTAIAPRQVTPQWLLKHELVDAEDAESATVMHASDKISNFKIGAVEFLITIDRLQLTTDDQTAVPLLFDFVEGIFSVLSSVLVKAVGFNAASHYDVKTKEEWHRIGHKMVPKTPWVGIMPENPPPGLLSASIQGSRDDEFVGFRNVTLEPSKKLTYGVFINLNEHIELPADDDLDDGVTRLVEAARHFRDILIVNSLKVEGHILK